MTKKEFLEGVEEALTGLCDSYDVDCGAYPESRYEGMALLKYYFEIQQGKQKEEK